MGAQGCAARELDLGPGWGGSGRTGGLLASDEDWCWVLGGGALRAKTGPTRAGWWSQRGEAPPSHFTGSHHTLDAPEPSPASCLARI